MWIVFILIIQKMLLILGRHNVNIILSVIVTFLSKSLTLFLRCGVYTMYTNKYNYY